jgi:hypothetical protein
VSDASGPRPREIVLVCPVLDDWESLARLVHELGTAFDRGSVRLHALVVDDGSTQRWDWARLRTAPDSCLASFEILRLVHNLGHQRAIAVGVVAAATRPETDVVLIMDGDGEDRPGDAVKLVAETLRASETIALALRGERSETPTFKAFYWLYKLAFRVLTGRPIGFGNFSAMPRAVAWRLAHMPELWNNLAATVLRSRLPVSLVPTARGTRYAGASRMSPVSLVMHGLGAISVYADVVLTRLLIGAAILAAATAIGIVIAIVIRFLTHLAIPGWTTTVVGILVVVLMQTIVLAVFGTFQSLAARSARPIIPLVDCGIFILERERRLAPGFHEAPPP